MAMVYCTLWEPHMEPCKHVSAWEDCCDHRGRVFISPRKLNCQGRGYSMAINCWPWGAGYVFLAVQSFWKLSGLSVLGGVLWWLRFRQSATTPCWLQTWLGISCVSIASLVPKLNPLVTLAWVQSSTGVSGLTDRRTAFHIPILYKNWGLRGTGGSTAGSHRLLLLKNS